VSGSLATNGDIQNVQFVRTGDAVTGPTGPTGPASVVLASGPITVSSTGPTGSQTYTVNAVVNATGGVQAYDPDLAVIAALTGPNGFLTKTSSTGPVWALDTTTYLSSAVTSLNGATGPITNVAKTTDKLSVFAATSSSELAGVLSDETGTGLAVFGTGPTLSQPIIDNIKIGYTTTVTSASTLALTSASNYKQYFTGTTASQVVTLPDTATLVTGQNYEINNNSTQSIAVQTSTAAAVVTVLSGTMVTVTCISTGGNTAAAWDYEFSGVNTSTGSGALVLSTTPTLVTPVLGVASATTINKVTLTAPATTSTLTIADGKTLTASNTLTFTGTDGSSLAIGTGGTLGTGAYATIANYAPLAAPSFTTSATAPIFMTTAPTNVTAGTYTVLATDNYINCTIACTVTLPAVASYIGRAITIKNSSAAAIISNASNVVPITAAFNGTAGTAILAATAGKFATLVSNGTAWVVVAAN
jgi:hypothetical protein